MSVSAPRCALAFHFLFRFLTSIVPRAIGAVPSLCLALMCFGFGLGESRADVIEFFDHVVGTPAGEFGWDDFGTVGAPYEGPHAPDQFSTGSGVGSLEVNSGGIITSTANLYSFFSTPEWTFEFTDLDATNSFTSIAVQIATSATLDKSHFTIGGVQSDEFIDLGQRVEIGGSGYNFYWAQWQGLSATDSLSVRITGTGEHESLAGAKTSYFNTSSSFNITAVPEPGSLIVLVPLTGIAFLRRRREHR